MLSAVTTLPCCAQQKWGTIKGQFLMDGSAPEPKLLEVTRDEEFCGKHKPKDESLLVGKDGGIRNIVVRLLSRKDVPVHPDFSVAPKPAELDNRNCLFHPRVTLLQCNQPLKAINSDSVAHNVAVFAQRNQPFSIVVPQDKPLTRSFPMEERIPIRVDCSIHAWMHAYLVISKHPYAAVTDEHGRFEIKNVPQGEWEFQLWHERPGYLTSITRDETTTLKRGILKVTVGQTTDLGTMKVPVKDFEEEN